MHVAPFAKNRNKNACEILWKASYLLGELGPMVVFGFRGRAAGICDWQTYSVCLQRSYLIRLRCPPKSWRLLFEIQIGLSLSWILYPYQILNRSYIASAIASSTRSPLYAFSKFQASLSEPFAGCSAIHSLLSPSNLLLVCFVRAACSLTFIYTPAQAYFFFPFLSPLLLSLSLSKYVLSAADNLWSSFLLKINLLIRFPSKATHSMPLEITFRLFLSID